jgi:hypothetical protein
MVTVPRKVDIGEPVDAAAVDCIVVPWEVAAVVSVVVPWNAAGVVDVCVEVEVDELMGRPGFVMGVASADIDPPIGSVLLLIMIGEPTIFTLPEPRMKEIEAIGPLPENVLELILILIDPGLFVSAASMETLVRLPVVTEG